jgi:hypothetical protein
MREVAQGKNAPLIGVKGFHVTPTLTPTPADKKASDV